MEQKHQKPRTLRSDPDQWPEHLRGMVPGAASHERAGVGAFRPLSHESALESRPLVQLAPGSLGRQGVLMRRDAEWLKNRSLSWHFEHRSNEDARGSRQVTLLIANFGNINRMGVNPAGIQEETWVQAYL